MGISKKKTTFLLAPGLHGTKNGEKKNRRSSLKGFQVSGIFVWAQHLVLSYKCPLKKRPPAVKIWWYSWETPPVFKGEQQMKLMTKHLSLCTNLMRISIQMIIVSWNAVYSNVMRRHMPKKHNIWVLNLASWEKPTSWHVDWSARVKKC